MNKRRIGFFSGLFGLIGICIAVAGVFLALKNRNAGPVLVEQPEAARHRVQTMMDALCEGDYDTVSGCLYGNPDLGIHREAEGEVGKLFWNALADSFRYEMEENFFATQSGVALNAKISVLNMESVTENLRERARSLMEQRISEVEDVSELYDENNEYREEFVMGALYDAARDSLQEDAEFRSWDLTLNLIYENGQWWIMPETELLQAISGGILG